MQTNWSTFRTAMLALVVLPACADVTAGSNEQTEAVAQEVQGGVGELTVAAAGEPSGDDWIQRYITSASVSGWVSEGDTCAEESRSQSFDFPGTIDYTFEETYWIWQAGIHVSFSFDNGTTGSCDLWPEGSGDKLVKYGWGGCAVH